MAAKGKSRFWRRARRTFRWFRLVVWFSILALLILAIWLHRVGLPDFVKERLVFALRERGMDLQFTRMRFVWYRGIVADNIRFGKSGEPLGPKASATEAEVHLRVRPLLQRRLDVEGVVLRDGHMTLPIWGTNERPRELAIEKINGELRFLSNDRWDLIRLRAETFGVKLSLGGTVTNASAIRRWKFGWEKPKAKTPQAFWHDLVSNFEQTKFIPPTEIIGTISGDAREIQTFRARITLSSPAIDSPWGRGRDFKLSANIEPEPGKLVHAELKLQAQEAETRWGSARTFQLEAQLTPSLTQWTPTNAHLNVQVKGAQTPWGNAASLAIKADFRPNPSEAASSLADYSIRGQQIQTPWGRFAQAELSASGVASSSNAWPRSARTVLKFAGGEMAAGRAASGTVEASLVLPAFESMQLANTNFSWWARLDQVAGDIDAQLTDLTAAQLEVKRASLKSSWKAPMLRAQELDLTLYDGEVRGSASLDTVSRVFVAEAKTGVDLRKLSFMLNTNARRWLEQFEWEQPPRISSAVRVTLPSWTNQAGWEGVDWRRQVLPTLSMSGSFQSGPASHRTIEVLTAQSDFTYSNGTWKLPNLHLTRPEGQAHIAHTAHEESREYQVVIDSTMDPRVLRPLFDPVVQEVFDDFTITTPPVIHAEISGHWEQPEKISARATCSITNAGYRAQPVLSCRSLITFTNQILSMIAPEVVRTEGTGRAASVVIDIPRLKLFINDASGMLDPAAVTRAIGPAVAATMEPYRFLAAPRARAHGFVDLEDGKRSDLLFAVDGGPFEWRAFKFQQITGIVHWAGTTLTLSNVLGSLHGGQMEGSAKFDFNVQQGADFAFRTLVHGIDLHSLVADIRNPTNKLEGTLAGMLVVTNANSEDLHSWFGHGNMTVQDGLIWDVPVFGLFSPLLNAVKPGAGNSKAKEVTAMFIITNSVIFTSDLRIYASGMRLNYDGIVDFDTRITGRMEAELFRDIPRLGQIVSKVLWPVTKLFEYRVSGTLSKPKSEPIFIPKIIMMPFHPLRTLRELLGEDKDEIDRRNP